MDRQPERESWRFPLDEKRKMESLGRIGRAAEKKQIRKYPSLAANIRSQLKFQSWKYWAVQGGILVAAMALVLYLSRAEADGEGAISVCAVFLVFAGNIGLSGLGRLFSRNMAELEQTLYLNLKQMVCIQMLFGGAADLLVLGMIVGIAGGQNEAGARSLSFVYAGSFSVVRFTVSVYADRTPEHMAGFLAGFGGIDRRAACAYPGVHGGCL